MITIIGVMLAAGTALMVTFYGGDGFFSGTDKAKADTLLNAGSNMRSAANLYYETKGALPKSPADLVGTTAMQSLPSLAGAGTASNSWRDFADAGEAIIRKAYVVNGISEAVCRYVNVNTLARGVRSIPSAPTGVIGCFKEAGANVFFTMINAAATGRTVALAPATGDQDEVVQQPASTPPSDSDDDLADYIRRSAAYVRYKAGGVPDYVTAQTMLGIASNAFNFLGKAGNFYFGEYDKRQYVMTYVSVEGLCQSLDRKSGGTGKVGRFNGSDNIATQEEGCGGSYGTQIYWRRIDDAQAAARVALMNSIGNQVYAAVQANGGRPQSLEAIGMGTPDFRGNATADRFVGANDDETYYRSHVTSEMVCSTLNAGMGGNARVGKFNGLDYSRTQGCGGEYGDMFYWRRVDPAFIPQQAAYLIGSTQSVATASAAAVDQGGSLASSTVLASINAMKENAPDRGSFFTLWDGNGLRRYASNPDRYMLLMVVQSDKLCAALDKAIGNHQWQGLFHDTDFTQATGCAGNWDGNRYYWRHLN